VETRGQSRPIVTPLRGDIRLAVSAILINPREIYRNALAHVMRGRESMTAVTERRKKSERVRFCSLRIASSSRQASELAIELAVFRRLALDQFVDRSTSGSLRVSKSSSSKLRGDIAVWYALMLFGLLFSDVMSFRFASGLDDATSGNARCSVFARTLRNGRSRGDSWATREA